MSQSYYILMDALERETPKAVLLNVQAMEVAGQVYRGIVTTGWCKAGCIAQDKMGRNYRIHDGGRAYGGIPVSDSSLSFQMEQP